ncbi:MAG: alpha-N-acetylglucosaminidase C-terminal domain-containing protein [Bacteroidaceae bacterium]|nr:alpha-N-acetylglucosaminidase C-terminal domain-containing protein [Bacteroidaceae bacterium]
MKKTLTFFFALLLAAPMMQAAQKVNKKAQLSAARQVIDRFLQQSSTANGQRSTVNVQMSMDKVQGCDQYCVGVDRKGTLQIDASSPVAACRAFYEYLRLHGYGINSWTGNRLQIPATFEPEADRHVVSPYKHHNYYNVVTYGYTLPYWSWPQWEKELDWMALHGVDMPLALVANEAISARVWKKLGLTDEEIQNYFVGPAHLPWMRMGNITKIDSPMPLSWHKDQIALQHKILQRMRELGMKPICPGFAGFLPPEIKRIYPEANLVQTDWDAFHGWMLMADDPLFPKIGKMFIEEWEKEFGKCEFYIADSFNEMSIPFPPKGTQERYDKLAHYGRTVFEGIHAANPDAVWVMQGWMLGSTRGIWDYETLSALLRDVPDDKMLILDMAADYNYIFWHNGANWEFYKGFDGKQWIFSTIPNMGGKTPLTGILEFYANGARIDALNSAYRDNLVGYGTEPEGTENNEVVYELISDAGWTADSINLKDWLQNYTLCRYGKTCDRLNDYWQEITQSAYGEFIDWPHYLWQLCPGVYERGTAPIDSLFLHALEQFADAAPQMKDSPLYATDLTEMVAHYASAKMEILMQSVKNCVMWDDMGKTDSLIAVLNDIAIRTDQVLSTHPILDMQRWIDFAKAHATNAEESAYYERNAKRIVTVWGPPVNDYSARIWSGLIRDFYLPRLNNYLQSLKSGDTFDVGKWEVNWVENSKGLSPVSKPADKVQAALDLMAIAKTVPYKAFTAANAKTFDHWTPDMMSLDWTTVEWPVPAAELEGLKGFSFHWTHGPEKLEISKVELLQDGKVVAVNEHQGETGLMNIHNDYPLTKGSVLNPQKDAVLRATVRTTGHCVSYGDVIIVR